MSVVQDNKLAQKITNYENITTNEVLKVYNDKPNCEDNRTFLHVLTINKRSTIVTTLCTQGMICSLRFQQQHVYASNFNLLHPNGKMSAI